MAWRNLNISLGLVNVPVGIDPLCDSSTRPSGKRVCPTDGTPLKQQNVCPDCGTVHTAETWETRYEGAAKGELVAGVELPDAPESSKLIELDTFVDRLDFSSIDKSYAVSTAKGHESGYAILHAAIRRTGTVAIGTVVLDKAPRQVAVEATENGLRMHYLRYADSFRAETPQLVDVDEKQVEVAVALIDLHRGEHTPIRDEYAAQMKTAISGGTVEAPAAVAEEAPDDLAAQLAASVEAAKAKKAAAKKVAAK